MQTTYLKPRHSQDVDKILFLDIETVGICQNYDDLEEWQKYYWNIKCHKILQWRNSTPSEKDPKELFEENAGIYAEFGKIVTIGLCYFEMSESGIDSVHSTCISNENEKDLLMEFKSILQDSTAIGKSYIGGHNIKEFDIPFLCRRMLINGIGLPNTLNLGGKKPWENKHLIDTFELWKFGDYKHYTSLDLLVRLFKIPSSKSDTNGSMIHDLYWKDKAIDKIETYCEKDAVVSALLFLKLNSLKLSDDFKHISKIAYI